MRKHLFLIPTVLVLLPASTPAEAWETEMGEDDCPMYPMDPGTVELCPADLDGDGDVGTFDLTLLQACWGIAETSPCEASDLDQDGDVDGFDLDYLLGNWGVCLGANLDGEGDVDCADLMILLDNRGNDCRFDLDHNGVVDENDETLLSHLWGSPGPAGDFDGDGIVGTSDLLQLLAAVGRDCRGNLDRDEQVDTCYDLEILLANWPR